MHRIDTTFENAFGSWGVVICYWVLGKEKASSIQHPASSHHRFFPTTYNLLPTTSIILLASLLLTKSFRNITFIYYGTAIWIFMNKMI
ncbi:MAG: hypothetical protein GY757_60140 [bacterium]|nr:hypothetical protein [bacterium]